MVGRLQHRPAARAEAQSVPGSVGHVPPLFRSQADAGQVFLCLRRHARRFSGRWTRCFKSPPWCKRAKSATCRSSSWVGSIGSRCWISLPAGVAERAIDAVDASRFLITDSPDEAVKAITPAALSRFGLSYTPPVKPPMAPGRMGHFGPLAQAGRRRNRLMAYTRPHSARHLIVGKPATPRRSSASHPAASSLRRGQTSRRPYRPQVRPAVRGE